MDGKYEIGIDHIRALAIDCHALDVQFDYLFNQPTICGSSDKIYRAYNRLLSTTLLNLAISIRVSLGTEPEYASNGIVEPAAIFLQGRPDTGGFSIKDICDKLIHADRIYRPKEPGVVGAGCELSGRHKGQQWVLGLGVRIFSEYVLRWLDQLEERTHDRC
jgi:hypothetical protein